MNWIAPPSSRRRVMTLWAGLVFLGLAGYGMAGGSWHRTFWRNNTGEAACCVGLYATGKGAGSTGLFLFPTGEFKFLDPDATEANDADTVRGTFEISGDQVVLKPDPIASGTSQSLDDSLEYRFLRWGCCRFLVPKDAMADFCKAGNAGRYSPLLTCPRYRLFRSRNCTGPHCQGLPKVPAEWTNALLTRPVSTQLTWVGPENRCRIPMGLDHGLQVGMTLYSEHFDSGVLEYTVTKVYAHSAELEEVLSRSGKVQSRRGEKVSSLYPPPVDVAS